MGHTIQGKQIGNIGFGLMGKPLNHPPTTVELPS
jgi:hypothetical protein